MFAFVVRIDGNHILVKKASVLISYCCSFVSGCCLQWNFTCSCPSNAFHVAHCSLSALAFVVVLIETMPSVAVCDGTVTVLVNAVVVFLLLNEPAVGANH